MPVKKIFVGLAIVLVVGAAAAANIFWREPSAPEVQIEEVARHELTAIVSGSGAIRPAREVDISSNVMGRITRMEVAEGETVGRGDLLLEIDPNRYTSIVEQMEASLEAARTQVQLAQEDLEFQREILDRREGLYRQDLLSRELYDQAVQNVQRARRNLETRKLDVARLQASLDQARYDLTQVTIDSPIDGIITRLNVEEGENVVTGTMNNAGTVILTIADLSVIEAEVEIDETDIVNVEVGQEAIVRIDAFPDEEFTAVVTEVGKSPIQQSFGQTSSGQAINFKVVVRLDAAVTRARPGLSCTADVITATRQEALAVPIQSLILREVEIDADGKVVREWEQLLSPGPDTKVAQKPNPPADESDQADGDAVRDDGEPQARDDERQTVEREGAFVLRDGRAVFIPIDIGIAGERHFEVLAGVDAGDKVITGPFDVLRSLVDGDRVQERDRPPKDEE